VSSIVRHFDLSDRCALVTGAASGIGRATAELLRELGARVIAADRDAEGLASLAEESGQSITTLCYEQSDLDSVRRLADEAGEVDILVNNAGILIYEPLVDLKLDDLERVVAVNLTGAIALTQAVGSAMVARRRGVIVHTGSQLTFNGAEFRAVYAATKAGISQFIKTAALEWGRYGVRVNCIAPGRTLTAINRHLLTDPADYAKALERIPLGRFGLPVDIANAIAFLVSDASAYVTGHTLVVDGGWILP
jgi:NAD(P)-dependent dehydrogenase (short-subunit alcohol dehydrogenase family)